MNSKVCITTFVYGSKYQSFIPFFIYSVKKAYPDYFVIIFVYGKLKDNVKKQLSILNPLGNFEVKENQFTELKISNRLEAGSVRWILPHEAFEEYRYLYISDIDIYFIIEPKNLHLQHIDHMNYLNLPFSNLCREYKINTRSLLQVYKRMKYAGIRNLLDYIRKGIVNIRQVTGLHFIEVQPYFERIRENQDKLKQSILGKTYIHEAVNNDELLLYRLLEKSGFDLSKMGTMSDSIKMLDFSNSSSAEFRPHHGLHLGIFKNNRAIRSSNDILQSKVYYYYVNSLKEHFNEHHFKELLKMSNSFIKKIFNRINIYYNL